jgi:hypothetical protein
VQFYTKCAILNPFGQFLKLKCAVTKINKNKTSKQSSHLLVFLVDAPDARNAVIKHQKSKCFLGEDHQTLMFSSQITFVDTVLAGGNGTGVKIGASEAIQKRLEWENLIFFPA